MADTRFGFQRILNNAEKLKRSLPIKLANSTQNFFVDSWRKQGWDDGGVKSWKPRRKETKKSIGRAILVRAGKLRRAVGQSIRSATFDKIQLVVALPYAKVHNEGESVTVKEYSRATFIKSSTSEFIGLRTNKKGQLREKIKRTTIFVRGEDQSVRSHQRTMPQRRFMGDSKTLRDIQKKVIDTEIQKVWQA